MKTIILALTLIGSMASANIGGGGSMGGAYALRGYYECGPKEGVSVAIDMANERGTIYGQNSQVELSLIGGGPSNGNAYYELEGKVEGKSFVVKFQSLMGAKIVKFAHPKSGKTYTIPCESATAPQQGF